MINDRGGLAIATLIFFLFALLISIIICRKHGFGRNGGWFFLIIFSLLRIAGSIAELVAVNSPSISSVITAAVLSGSGFSTLLMVQIGFLQRLNEGIPSEKGRIPPIVFRLMILALIVALALSITAGVNSASSSASSQKSATTYYHVAGGLFAGAFGLMTLESLFTALRLKYIIRGDRKLLFAIGAVFPFLLVRLIYAELIDFRIDYDTLNTITGSVIAQAFMASLEEYVAVAIFLAAGWLTPKIERQQLKPGKYMGEGAREAEGKPAQGYEMGARYQGQESGSV